MAPKRGRPTSAPKKNRLEIRLTDLELKMLEECADKMNTTKTNVITQGVRLVKAEIEKKPVDIC